MKKIIKNKKGITLISLVITIIVLLILAGISIATLTGDNSLLNKTNEAKLAIETAENIEKIELSLLQAESNLPIEGSYEQYLEDIMNKNFNNGPIDILNYSIDILNYSEDNGFIIKVTNTSTNTSTNTNQYYNIDKDKNVTYIENTTKEKTLTIQCVNGENDLLAEKTYTIVTNNYSILPPNISGYESKNAMLEGTITEDTKIKAVYYYIIQENDLIFTGLNSNGQTTTNENEIVSYMIGDNTNVGYKTLNKQSILKVPTYYNNKKITKIGSNAFAKCQNLKKIVVEDNIESIGQAAFCHCLSLESVIIGDGITTIPMQMCWGSALSYLYLGKNVKNIATELAPFNYCGNLTTIEISTENKDFIAVDGIIYNKEKTEIVVCSPSVSGTFNIDNNITSIKSSAFSSCSLITQINFGNGVTTIGSGAFTECLGFTEIVISGNVSTLSTGAFQNCFNLKKIKLDDNVSTLNEACFAHCTRLESVELGKGIKRLDRYIFSNTKVTTFKYNGTIDEWNNISKDVNWNYNSPITTIICTDGTINI